jgi:hypothetical protein
MYHKFRIDCEEDVNVHNSSQLCVVAATDPNATMIGTLQQSARSLLGRPYS